MWSSPRGMDATLHQPALLNCCADERREQRVRLEWPRFQLGMELHADKPGMIFVLDDFGQNAIGRHSREAHAPLLEPALVASIDLVSVAVSLGYFGSAIDLRDPAAPGEHRVVSAQAHGPAEIAADTALLQLVALEPLGHQTNHGLGRAAELGGIGVLDAAEIARGFHHGHLHSETNSEIRHIALAGELNGLDFALRATLAKSARNEDAIDMFKKRRRILVLKHLGLDPVEIGLHLVGDATVRKRFDQ